MKGAVRSQNGMPRLAFIEKGNQMRSKSKSLGLRPGSAGFVLTALNNYCDSHLRHQAGAIAQQLGACTHAPGPQCPMGNRKWAFCDAN